MNGEWTVVCTDGARREIDPVAAQNLVAAFLNMRLEQMIGELDLKPEDMSAEKSEQNVGAYAAGYISGLHDFGDLLQAMMDDDSAADVSEEGDDAA